MGYLLAGSAALDITPSASQWLDGFGNRTAPSEGAYLPIQARALAFEKGSDRALILSAEVLGFDRARTAALKDRIARRSGLDSPSIILTATHTHCAPRVCDMIMPGEVDPSYRDWFETRCVEVAEQAWENRIPARVEFSRAKNSLGVNRRTLTDEGVIMHPNSQGPRDPDLDTLWVRHAETGAIIGTLTCAACHPTCRGGTRIGGDYPGFLCRELESAVGGVALFVLGCAGDVRPQFTDERGRFRMAELWEVEAAGKHLAETVLQATGLCVPVEVPWLKVRRKFVAMPLAARPAEGELRKLAQQAGADLHRQWARELLQRIELPDTIPFELQAIWLGPQARIVFLAGEVASEYALRLKNDTGKRFQPMIVAAYANGAVGYVPSATMYPLGGYEVNGSHPYYNLPAAYTPDVEERLLQATLEMLD